MTEYIDKEKFRENLEVDCYGRTDIVKVGIALDRAKVNMDGAVIPVRCKDCKYLRVVNEKYAYAYCPKTDYLFKPFDTDTRTHYCSYGKRKDNG